MDKQAPTKSNDILQESPSNDNKVIENINKNQDITSPQDNKFNIREKRVYKQFLKQIKGKRAINGVIMADILGVTRQTVYKWLGTPKALEILQNNIDTLTNKIQDNKDWKASAYLLDKLYDKAKDEQGKTDLKQLIVINT